MTIYGRVVFAGAVISLIIGVLFLIASIFVAVDGFITIRAEKKKKESENGCLDPFYYDKDTIYEMYHEVLHELNELSLDYNDLFSDFALLQYKYQKLKEKTQSKEDTESVFDFGEGGKKDGIFQ